MDKNHLSHRVNAGHIAESIAMPELERYPHCVLCVEDNRDIMRVIQLSLERVGNMRTHACHDARLALDMARELNPDLIVLDLKMPYLDGRAVFRRLQATPELRRIPVVFLMASAAKSDVEELQKLGAAGIFTKPFDAGNLAELVAGAWRRATGAGH